MASHKKMESLKAVRVATLLFPPLGLVLLWRSSQVGWVRKFFGTAYIFGVGSLYFAAFIAVLYFGFGMDVIEWRGGYMPAITFAKTKPDYTRLEASRAQQPKTTTTSPVSTNAYWTGFRGPNRDGHYDEKPIATQWPKGGLRELWRQPIGGGYASFAIAEGRAYTIEQRREMEAATAYDIATGRELWATVWNAKFEEPLGGEGPRATPTWDAGRVYLLGGLGEFRCLDAATGKTRWRHDIIAENQAEILTYGIAASPLIVADKVIVVPGGSGGKLAVAYNKLTGSLIWKSQHDNASYVSPMLVSLAGKPEIMVVSATSVMGLQPEDGRQLWHNPWQILNNQKTIAQPVMLSSNRFFLSGGYGTGCKALEISTNQEVREAWRNKYLKNKFTSSVFYNGFIYGLDEDILTCLDAQTGDRKWKDGRYGYGQLVLAGNQLIILSGEGELALVKADPDHYEETARFQAIHGKTWNHPALSDGKIFVRNAVEMACFDLVNF